MGNGEWQTVIGSRYGRSDDHQNALYLLWIMRQEQYTGSTTEYEL
jgi:hypothetical protein